MRARPAQDEDEAIICDPPFITEPPTSEPHAREAGIPVKDICIAAADRGIEGREAFCRSIFPERRVMNSTDAK